ncbi:hypothetical protein Trydic_g14586 [Trypoxylus dichotomus]
MDEVSVGKWCIMFNDGRKNSHDEHRSGWPSVVTDGLKTRIERKIQAQEQEKRIEKLERDSSRINIVVQGLNDHINEEQQEMEAKMHEFMEIIELNANLKQEADKISRLRKYAEGKKGPIQQEEEVTMREKDYLANVHHKTNTPNVRMLLETDKLEEVMLELEKYRADLTALQEIRCKGYGTIDKTRRTIHY